MHKLIALAVVLTLLGGVFGVLQHLWPAVPRQRRSRRALLTDLCWWVYTTLLGNPLMRVALFVVIGLPWLLLAGTGPRAHLLHGYGPLAALPLAAQAALMLVVGDLIGYWQHRAFHGRWLWRYHAVHHGIRELTWIAAVRVHPVNDIGAKLAQVLPLVALGFSPAVGALYAPFLTVYALGLHANLRWDFGPLRCVLASPAFHRWHHARDASNCNFAGLLPLWDIVFGTFYLPRGAHPRRFGIAGNPVPEGFLGQLAYPFRRTP